MRKLLFTLALACLAAACADAPADTARSAPPRAPAAYTGAFGVQIEMEKMADETNPTWYFHAPLQNASSTSKFDYYYQWTTPIGDVLREGWGLNVYSVDAGQTGEVNLAVNVTGPDGFAQASGDWGPYPIPSPSLVRRCTQGWC